MFPKESTLQVAPTTMVLFFESKLKTTIKIGVNTQRIHFLHVFLDT